MAVLSTTYLMEDHPSLKGLIQAIVTLSAKCKDEKASDHQSALIENNADILTSAQSSQLVGKCADFCVFLIQYVEEDAISGSRAVDAVEEFSRCANAE